MPTRLDFGHLISLFENATEGTILINGEGNIMLVNPAPERMFNYNNDEITDQPIEIFIPDQFKPHHHKLREGFYHHSPNRPMGQDSYLYGRRKDETEGTTGVLSIPFNHS